MKRLIEVVDVDSPEVHKKLVLQGAKLILDLQEEILKEMKTENPKWPGLTWDMIFFIINELKEKEPKFVSASSLEDAMEQLND